jgi:hypothetical protein
LAKLRSAEEKQYFFWGWVPSWQQAETESLDPPKDFKVFGFGVWKAGKLSQACPKALIFKNKTSKLA